jgi:hypothetical protein
MSQPTVSSPDPQATDSARADEQTLLAALARLVLGRTRELHFTFNDAGAMLTATGNDPFASPRLFLHRASAAVYVVPSHVPNFRHMLQLVADPRRRAGLEVVWREPTATSPDARLIGGEAVTVVMTETIVFRHTFTRAEVAEALGCAPADVEQQVAEHGGDDGVWLRETLAEHFSHSSDRALSVEVTR